MAKKEIENKKELARILFMNGENQKDIADRVSVSRVSVNKWAKDGGWAEKRAAKAVTRPELVNKLLRAIDTMLNNALDSDNPDVAGLGDKLAKVASSIEKLDKKSGVVNSIEVFIAFGKWLEHRMSIDKDVDAAFVKKVTKYQDTYINEQFTAR